MPDSIRFGDDFELDVRAYELRSAGIPLKLKPIAMELLLLLLERRGQLVTREQIIERIWGKGVFLDTDNSINGAISKIRQLLRDNAENPRFVQTVTGKGYRFVAPITGAGSPPVAQPAASQTAAPEHLIGKKVSHYRILQVLGGGGMGVVYKGEDLKLGRRVAIKFLPGELASDPKAFERLESEARAASALDHPNICPIYELGEHEGQPFIVMQLLEGQTLQERIESASQQKKALSTSEVLDLALQVLAGLEAAHEKGIIHRDVKPANIFITANRREAKILDFGLAKMVEQNLSNSPATDQAALTETSASQIPKGALSNLRLTRTGTTMGTAYYMSPEQVRGETLDARTDLFSFGLVLYEMATGQRAFPGNTVAVVHDAILHQAPLPIQQINPELSDDLEPIITKALEKDREQRYRSAAEIRDDLLRLTRDTTSKTAPVLPVSPSARVWKRLLWAGIGAVVAGIIWGTYQRLVARPSPFQRMEMTQLTTTGNVLADAISPDGRYVAYAVDEVGEGQVSDAAPQLQESLWIRQVAGREVRLIGPAGVRYGGLVFSRDGDFLYFVRAEAKDPDLGSVYKIPVLGGTARRIISDVAPPFALTFSPDGKQVAFVRESSERTQSALMVANAEGGGEKQLATRKFPAGFERADWSPGGKSIATLVYNNEAGVDYESPFEVTVPGGRERLLTPLRWFAIWGLAWLQDGRGLIVITQEQNGGPSQIGYLSLETGEVRRITTDLNSYGDASLTADFRTLAAIQARDFADLWVVPVANPDSIKPITSGGVSHAPAWSPDGRIIYEQMLDKGTSFWIIDPDGGNPRQLAANYNSRGRDFHLRVSPDGRFIVFVSERTGGDHVWRMDIDGNDPRQLTNSLNDHLDIPDVSPDGKWVLYSKRGAEIGIWKVSIDGGDPVQLNHVEANTPVVSPDGKMIAYFYHDARENPPQGVAFMPFEGGPPIRKFEMPHQYRQFRWTPDGRSLLYIKGEGSFSNLWSQPIAGGAPRQITHFNSEQIYSFDLSRYGKQLVLHRGKISRDVVLIHDIN